MAFLKSIFGLKTPTLADARKALAEHERQLVAAPARIAAAEAALSRVADMTDAEHAAALAQREAAVRLRVRLEAQVVDLQAAVAGAERAERAVDLRARREAANKRMAAMPKALDTYDRHADAAAGAASEIDAIDAEVAAVNREIAEAKAIGLDAPEPVPTSFELYRSEPDTVEPDQTVVEEVWMHQNDRGRWVPVVVFGERDGKLVPTVAGAQLRRMSRIIEGFKRPGICIDAPTVGLCLPASRVGRDPHWPRSA